MTENKRFERIYEDVDVFCRDHNAKGISQLIEKGDYDKIVNLLNELHEEKKELHFLCNHLRDQANEFHRKALENVNLVGKLERENKELKAKVDDKEVAVEVETCKVMEKIFDLIDKKIKEADEGFEQTYDSWYQGQIDALKELKKEL